VTITDDALYTVTVTDECGNTADTILSAVVLDHDPLVLTVMNDTIVCPGEQVQLWVTVEGGAGGYQITWQGVGIGSPVTWTVGNNSTVVGVTVTDICGITVQGSVALDVYPASAHIEATQLGDSYWSFSAETDPSSGNDLEWDLGDGTIVLDQTTVTHTYTDVDAHWVLLYMVTADGCVAVDSVLTEPPSATLYFPNTFSPNGDGINDSFGGEGRLVEVYELLIFDRWGRIMFESQDITVRWDGRMDGQEVMDGVYQYKYKAKGLKMPLHQKFGHVTLLR
jgi:gliding motility-associated-like protein